MVVLGRLEYPLRLRKLLGTETIIGRDAKDCVSANFSTTSSTSMLSERDFAHARKASGSLIPSCEPVHARNFSSFMSWLRLVPLVLNRSHLSTRGEASSHW